MTTACTHEHTTAGVDRGFAGPVVTGDRENRAAHGCVTYTETCDRCGAQRQTNQNQCHLERGSWGPSRAEREAEERRRQERLRREREALEDASVAEHQVVIVDVTETSVLMYLRGQQHAERYQLHQIRAAASQPDNGDGLVPFYRGLLRAVEDCDVGRGNPNS